MVKSGKDNRQPDRLKQILNAALRRYCHFGIQKTTLTEVADDLAMTKQGLSHYFPDKQSLVNAVIEKITTEYSHRLKQKMEEAESVEEGLKALVEVKSYFYEKYYLLASQAGELEIFSSESMLTWKQSLLTKELGLIVTLFENGIRNGELKTFDTKKTGMLLLDTIYVYNNSVKEKGALPDPGLFKEVMQKQHEVIQLFYQGLKAETWKK